MIDKPYLHIITMEIKLLSEFPPETPIRYLARVKWVGGKWRYV